MERLRVIEQFIIGLIFSEKIKHAVYKTVYKTCMFCKQSGGDNCRTFAKQATTKIHGGRFSRRGRVKFLSCKAQETIAQQEMADFKRKVKKERLSEDEENGNPTKIPILSRHCFVNIHKGTDLNDITNCPKCPNTFSKNSKNLEFIKKEKLQEDQSFLLKVNNIKSFREKFQQNKNEFFKVEVAAVSNRYYIDMIELSSDSEVEETSKKTSSISNTNKPSISLSSHEEKIEKWDKIIVKNEIKSEKNENNLSNINLINDLSPCKKEKFEVLDNSIFEPSVKYETMEDLNLRSPTCKSSYETEKSLEINNNDKDIKENFEKGQLVKDFLCFEKENSSLDEEFKKDTQVEFICEEKSESMKKLELLRNYCETFECVHCGKRFSSKTVCKAHVEIVHEGGKPYKCKVCEKSFKYTFSRRQHYFKEHKNIKTYKCSICGKQFLTYGWYQRHKCSVRKFKN